MQDGAACWAPITDLSESEAAASLPQMCGGTSCSGHRVSVEHGQHHPADAEASTSGDGGHPSGRTPIRQDVFWYEGDAEPLWWDAEDIFADAEDVFADAEDIFAVDGLDCSASAAPERSQRQEVFNCAICFDDHSLEDCYIASACGHCMCRDAAREVVLGAVRSWSFPVLCPICQAKPEPRCILCSARQAAIAAAEKAGQENISSGPSAWCCTLIADIPLLLTVEEEQQYLERSFKTARNSCAYLMPCPQPDCEGMAAFGQEDEGTALKCDACGHKWCSKCNVEWHSNKSCDDYQRDFGQREAEKGLEEYRKYHFVMNCPTCNHGIEKTSGCNHMRCTRCHTSFTWLGRY